MSRRPSPDRYRKEGQPGFFPNGPFQPTSQRGMLPLSRSPPPPYWASTTNAAGTRSSAQGGPATQGEGAQAGPSSSRVPPLPVHGLGDSNDEGAYRPSWLQLQASPSPTSQSQESTAPSLAHNQWLIAPAARHHHTRGSRGRRESDNQVPSSAPSTTPGRFQTASSSHPGPPASVLQSRPTSYGDGAPFAARSSFLFSPHAQDFTPTAAATNGNTAPASSHASYSTVRGPAPTHPPIIDNPPTPSNRAAYASQSAPSTQPRFGPFIQPRPSSLAITFPGGEELPQQVVPGTRRNPEQTRHGLVRNPMYQGQPSTVFPGVGSSPFATHNQQHLRLDPRERAAVHSEPVAEVRERLDAISGQVAAEFLAEVRQGRAGGVRVATNTMVGSVSKPGVSDRLENVRGDEWERRTRGGS